MIGAAIIIYMYGESSDARLQLLIMDEPESNLRMVFGIDVCIGTHRIGSNDYKYIIPMH